MPISFSCQACGAEYSVKEELAGKKGRCAKCQAPLAVPQLSDNDLDPADIRFLDETDASSSSPPPPQVPSSIYTDPGDLAARSRSMPLHQDEGLRHDEPLRYDEAPRYAEPPSLGPPSLRVTSVHSARPGTVAADVALSMPRREKKKANRAGVDTISVWIVLLWFVALLVQAVIGATNYPGSRYDHRSKEEVELVTSAISSVGKPWMPSLLLPVALVIGMFTVMGPLMLLAWFIVSKIWRSELPQGAYMRAIGVAVLPLAFLLLIDVLQIDSTWILKITCILLSLPLAWLMIHFLHGEEIGPAAAVVGFGVLFYVPGLIGTIVVAGLIVAGPAITYEKKVAEEVKAQWAARHPAPPSESTYRPTVSGTPTYRPPVPVYRAPAAADPNAGQKATDLGNIQSFKGRVGGLSKRTDAGGLREPYTEELFTLRTEILAAEPQLAQYSEYTALRTDLATLEQKVSLLPSSEPDPEVFKKAVAGEMWDAGEAVAAYTPEVTILDRFFIRTPPAALVELGADFAQSARWKSPDGSVTFTLTLQDRGDPRQQMPWVVLPSMTLLAREKQLMFIVSDERKQSTGSVGSMVLTRGHRSPTETSPFASTRYIGLVDDKWLVADISARQKDDAWFAQFENAVRTLRLKREKDKVVHPLSPQLIVNRLADSPEAAGELLRKADKAAEPYVLEVATQPAHPARAAAVGVLADIGTEKSVELFWELSRHYDPSFYKPARTGLRRLVPDKANSVTFAIEDLDLPATAEAIEKKRDALAVLAATPADERRAAVAVKLETILTSATPPELLPEAGAALAIWSRKETVEVLLPFVQSATGEQNPALDPIIRALGGCQDDRVVMPILSWAGKRLPAVTDACVSLGSLAEDDLIKLLSMTPQARTVACDILAKMGSSRAVYMLERTAKDKNATPELQTKAREAVAAIKLREPAKPKK